MGNENPTIKYCPICGRVIMAPNIEQVELGLHNGFIFVHDDIIHTDEDLEALRYGVQ